MFGNLTTLPNTHAAKKSQWKLERKMHVNTYRIQITVLQEKNPQHSLYIYTTKLSQDSQSLGVGRRPQFPATVTYVQA